MERVPHGCVKFQFLDGYNFVNIDAIELKFEGNVVEDI